MGRKRNFIALTVLMAAMGTAYAQDYFDDVYYNPKKDKSQEVVTKQKQKESTYIANMADMDVDAYNRRGQQYYVSEIDTIGSRVENGEDFVYTQQIQKYYNPTIVVDNAKTLGDVLSNAYGNVDIVINDNGLPIFSPWYGWNYSYYSPWSWGFNIGPWGWSIGYNPWYWNWGPSWGWGPSWSWNWAWNWGPVWGPGPGWGPGPSWGPGPGWGPGPRPGWGGGPGPMATWSPGGNRTVAPRPGWSGRTQPGLGMAAGRPTTTHRNPQGNIAGNNRPSNPTNGRPTGVVNNNGRWQYNTTNQTGHRQAGTGVVSNGTSNHRTSTPRTNVGTTKNTTTNSTVTNRSYNSGSRSTMNRSTGGGVRSTGGGGRSTGGGGRHR